VLKLACVRDLDQIGNEEYLIRLTKFDEAQSNSKTHMYGILNRSMLTYGFVRKGMRGCRPWSIHF
jgi:hypothetical protein